MSVFQMLSAGKNRVGSELMGPAGMTVISEVPVLPSQVAVMVAVPAATPLTSPLPFTVAAAVLSLDQVTTRPETGSPPTSTGVAVRPTEPTMAIVAEAGLTATEATGVSPTGLPWLETFEQETNPSNTRIAARAERVRSRCVLGVVMGSISGLFVERRLPAGA